MRRSCDSPPKTRMCLRIKAHARVQMARFTLTGAPARALLVALLAATSSTGHADTGSLSTDLPRRLPVGASSWSLL